MQPPWVEFPDIPRGSIGWRMGHGEDYIHAFIAWFGDMSPEQRRTYTVENSEPEGWGGFYDRHGG